MFFVTITWKCRNARKIRNVFPLVVPFVLHIITTNGTMLNTTESQETCVLISLNDIPGDICLTGLRFYPYWGEKVSLHHIKVKRTSTVVCEYVHSKFNSTCERVLCINCPIVGASTGVVLPVKHLLYSTATSKQLRLNRG